MSHVRPASSFTPITVSAKSTTGTPACDKRDHEGHRFRSNGQVFPVHPRTLCSVRGCNTHCPTPLDRFRALHRVSTRATAHSWFYANSNRNNRWPSAVGWGEKRPLRAMCLATCSSAQGKFAGVPRESSRIQLWPLSARGLDLSILCNHRTWARALYFGWAFTGSRASDSAGPRPSIFKYRMLKYNETVFSSFVHAERLKLKLRSSQ